MKRPALLALALFVGASSAHAGKVKEPCRTKSRQMTLVKNCYSGEMVKPLDGGSQFFSALNVKTPPMNFCYNSLVTVEHKPGTPNIHIRVLRDDKTGQFHAYHYSLNQAELKKNHSDVPTFALQGLKGECFSADPDTCHGGILKAIGWLDSDVPMVVALGKASNGQFTVSHLVQNRDEIDKAAPKELPGEIETDANHTTQNLLQEIRQKIITIARAKSKAMQAGISAKKLADTSEQFRYCSMALEGFLRDKKMSDPFSSDEKMTLATLTNYMNNDAAVPQASSTRKPASKR